MSPVSERMLTQLHEENLSGYHTEVDCIPCADVRSELEIVEHEMGVLV